MSKRRALSFDMKVPCDDCPFRRVGGVRLMPSRAEDIAMRVTDGYRDGGSTFSCHKTTGVGSRRKSGVPEQHCAGALILAEKLGVQIQQVQIMTRLRLIDVSGLRCHDDVFDSIEEMVAAQLHD